MILFASFFTSGFFWFFEGILACLVIIAIRLWAEDRGVPMPFWKWILVVCWMIGFGFTIAFVGTSIGENEMRAAQLGGLIFGTVVIIMGIILWRVILLGRKKEES